MLKDKNTADVFFSASCINFCMKAYCYDIIIQLEQAVRFVLKVIPIQSLDKDRKKQVRMKEKQKDRNIEGTNKGN
jgi:hypothetical protein